jgi:hypothetical protein
MKNINETKLEILRLIKDLNNSEVDNLLQNASKVLIFLRDDEVCPTTTSEQREDDREELQDKIIEKLSFEESLKDPIIKLMLKNIAYFQSTYSKENSSSDFRRSLTLLDESSFPPYIDDTLKKAILKICQNFQNQRGSCLKNDASTSLQCSGNSIDCEVNLVDEYLSVLQNTAFE